MGLRIAVGSGRCADFANSRDPVVRELCLVLTTRLGQLRERPLEQLRSLPPESHDLVQIGNKVASVTTYRDPTESGEEIVVVQGFLRSLRHPRYFGSIGVGLMLAEGLLLDSDGPVAAPEDLLWGYR